jgi:uncharacterized protein YjbI with pentapeptide repeats
MADGCSELILNLYFDAGKFKQVEDVIFDKVDFKAEPLQMGEYEACEFRNCDLSNADLSGMIFMDCRFTECNLSMAKLSRASFREVVFEGCKMVGLHFEDLIPFLAPPEFINCDLSISSFFEIKAQKIKFIKCQLNEVDFTGANLTEGVFEDSDLQGAIFSGTNLEKADFRTSRHYVIDPTKNKVQKAKFSLEGAVGLLDQFKVIID